MDITISQAIPAITLAIMAALAPMIEGSPAIGKSGIVHQIAKTHNLKVIDVRLGQCDPTDANGFPVINPKTGRAHYAPMETFPIVGDPLPTDINEDGSVHTYAGWILFFDEFSSATRAVQAAAYKIVLDRMVGKFHLHKNVAIVCAGNRETDNAIVEPMSTALQSRLCHIELVVSADEWINWALQNNIDHRIVDFINFMPGKIYTFKPDHTDKTYAAPRTWEFMNRVIKAAKGDLDNESVLILAIGSLSEGVAREFLLFCKIYKDLPTIAQIIDSPQLIKVPDEPSILFALTGTLSSHADKDNLGQLMQYVNRLPIEFQVVCLRMIIKRDQKLFSVPAIQKWLSVNGDKMY